MRASVDEELRVFAERWVRARTAATMARNGHGDVREADAELLGLVTTREPYASRVREDLRLVLRGYLPMGFGMTVEVEPTTEHPFESWSRSIAPLSLRLSWSNDMSGASSDELRTTLDRVAFEADGWRVLSLFDDAGRARARMEAELLDRMRGR